ncbi:hypothetical protein HDU83_003829, partial [Entophlyctis luteolus]
MTATFWALLTLSAAAARALLVTDVVTFGDSASDNGNYFAATGLPTAPYWHGRFSNGPVWVEYLAQYLSNSTLHDYAWAYSTANVSDAISSYSGIPDLFAQLKTFKNETSVNYETTVFTVFSGANDIDYEADSGALPDSAAIARYVIEFVGELLDTGAKQVLVGNLPPLDLLPVTLSSYGAALLQVFRQLTIAYNAVIEAGVADLSAKYPNAKVVLLDINYLINYTVSAEGAAFFGYTNTVDACFNSTSKVVCANPDEYVFWDYEHPTTKDYDILAQFAVNSLNGVKAILLPKTTETVAESIASTTPATATSTVGYSQSVAASVNSNLNSGVPKLLAS